MISLRFRSLDWQERSWNLADAQEGVLLLLPAYIDDVL
ncbi:Hypothetical protein Cul05146_0448 [Corynebacterium ulcerans]|uniref:Transposase n=1 Tax=Corynebacterium ulcerans FRC58 TaxID=1408268 RepID=A0ABM5TYS8_CORUL|nr:Hypothetical protein Cul05146_0448 [Corynebacterium ulcerans]AKN76328.1 Hypothetical protein CulFRC58_0474 [Corynebacterium ulcerans FRC58]